MKKNIYILLALLLGLSLTTCKKDAVPDKLIVNAEVKEVTTSSVIIEGSYEYSMEITEFEMFYSTTDDMNGSQSVKITPEGNDFSVELTDLEDNTQYYFNFVFTGKYNSTTTEEVCDFKTLEVKIPTLTTNNISNIMETTAECGGNVTDDGGGTVTERGICWSTSHYPSVMDNRTKNGGGTGAFTAKMTNLKPNTKYYVRAYATNEKGTNYGAEKGFTTRDVVVELPTVTTKTVSEITATTARSGGNVTDDGGGEITARGVCWSSTSSFPKVNDSHTIDGKGTGSFYSTLTDLNPNTTYYVRAYAINEIGTVYGSLKSFTTLDDGSISVTEPTVTTRNVTAITANSATCGGTVTDEGGAPVTEYGVCWGISPNPTIDNLYDESTVDGDGAGSFISQLTNLKENTTYYVRAYATNKKGTSYGEEFTFTTIQEEQQETTGSIDGYDYVDLGLPSGLKWATCNIGANSPEEYGNYYAWGETTTKSDYFTSETDELSILELQSQGYIDGNNNLTPQYDAAMANWGGNWRMPTYDEQRELLDNCTWTWTTQGGNNGYKVTGPNGNQIFLPAAGYRYAGLPNEAGEIGSYWSSTLSESRGNSASALSFITNNQPYTGRNSCCFGQSVRPVSGGNNYEPIILLPTVTTTDVTNITSSSATSGGNVTFDGNATVTSRGVCWGTYPNPTINDNKTVDGSGTGSFTSKLTNLTENTTYYVRAYATNNVGTSYGEEFTFTTLQEEGQQEPTGSINGYDYVDLGLPSGLKWATCNIGANSPEEYGNYYAWGETETKPIYHDTTGVTGGLSTSELLSQGYIDGNNNLTPSHDAAAANWGSTWRIPTSAEYQELIDNCTWTWTTQGGNNGYKVTGPNGNHIFLPAAGYRFWGSSLYSAGEYGSYWSSTQYYGFVGGACGLYFNDGYEGVDHEDSDIGKSVRPVSE